MTTTERRAEIMKILTARRHETMKRLAAELGVTARTIRTDITVLTVDYPLTTVRGNGGCVKVADWYRPQKNIFSREQHNVLTQLMAKADEPQQKVLSEMLAAFGSSAVKEQYAKENMRI